jgi:hypothetical protein
MKLDPHKRPSTQESVDLQAFGYSILTIGHYFFFLEPYLSSSTLDRIGYCINGTTTGIEENKSVIDLNTLVVMTCCWLISYPDPMIAR